MKVEEICINFLKTCEIAVFELSMLEMMEMKV